MHTNPFCLCISDVCIRVTRKRLSIKAFHFCLLMRTQCQCWLVDAAVLETIVFEFRVVRSTSPSLHSPTFSLSFSVTHSLHCGNEAVIVVVICADYGCGNRACSVDYLPLQQQKISSRTSDIPVTVCCKVSLNVSTAFFLYYLVLWNAWGTTHKHSP